MKPSVARIVHYRSYGTPGGEYLPECRAAIVTGVVGFLEPRGEAVVDLCVLNPTGMFFNQNCQYSTDATGGTWHWPERVE